MGTTRKEYIFIKETFKAHLNRGLLNSIHINLKTESTVIINETDAFLSKNPVTFGHI